MVDNFKGRGGSPWGSPPGGGGNGSGRGPTPPDIDEIIRKIQGIINKFLPGGRSGGKPVILILAVLGLIWIASGLYRVLPDEQGVVLTNLPNLKTTPCSSGKTLYKPLAAQMIAKIIKPKINGLPLDAPFPGINLLIVL